MEANSNPMTPPPMMHNREGAVVRLRISVEVTTPAECAPSMGRNFDTDPVAMIRSLAWCSSLPTRIVWASTKRASPSTNEMPGVFISMAIPSTSCLTILFLCSTTFVKSSVSFSSRRCSALCARHFVGMHPSFRQVPPKCFASISVTVNPALAASIAVSYPPGPAPIMIKSDVVMNFQF